MNEELSECTLTWYWLFIECQTQLYELYAINE